MISGKNTMFTIIQLKNRWDYLKLKISITKIVVQLQLIRKSILKNLKIERQKILFFRWNSFSPIQSSIFKDRKRI